jgi:hypothetical protein
MSSAMHHHHDFHPQGKSDAIPEVISGIEVPQRFLVDRQPQARRQ